MDLEVSFAWTVGQAAQFHVREASLYSMQAGLEWRVSKGHKETVYGLSCILRQLPDRLETALIIEADLSSASGKFVLDSFVQLLQVIFLFLYRSIAANVELI